MRKRILFCIPYLGGGGAEKVLSIITTNFPREYDIDILANSDSQIGYPYRGNIISLGVDRPNNVLSVWFQFKVFIKRTVKLFGLKRTGKYLACYSFMDSANIANILSGKRQCKTILSVHTSLIKSSSMPQYRFVVNPLVRFFYNRADKIITVSKGIQEELINAFHIKADRILTIINGCDKSDIANKVNEGLPLEYKKIFDKKVVLNVGRLTEAKAQWHLIRAFREVSNNVDANLVFVGEGDLETYLKKVSYEAGISDRVFFLGHQSNPYVFMKYATLFVLSSVFEGFPCAMAEAMCVGTPCVSTNFGIGSEELIYPDFGILTSSCSGKKYEGNEELEGPERELADAILTILSSPENETYYRQKSFERSRCLGLDEMISKWLTILKE